MSLQLDSIFIQALSADSGISEAVGGRVYGTAIPLPDSEAENVPLPYIIVTFDGMTNVNADKENYVEGDEDITTISVEIVGETLEGLHTLTQGARETIREYMAYHISDDNTPDYYSLTAGAINYDSSKPCYWQVLTYQCNINNY